MICSIRGFYMFPYLLPQLCSDGAPDVLGLHDLDEYLQGASGYASIA